MTDGFSAQIHLGKPITPTSVPRGTGSPVIHFREPTAWFPRFCSSFPPKEMSSKPQKHLSLFFAVSSSEGTIFFASTLFNVPRGFTTFSFTMPWSLLAPQKQHLFSASIFHLSAGYLLRQLSPPFIPLLFLFKLKGFYWV